MMMRADVRDVGTERLSCLERGRLSRRWIEVIYVDEDMSGLVQHKSNSATPRFSFCDARASMNVVTFKTMTKVAARLTVMLHVVPQLTMKTSEARLSRTASLSTKAEIS